MTARLWGLAALSSALLSSCATLLPELALQKPPRDVEAVPQGAEVAFVGPRSIMVSRNSYTDYEPVSCDAIEQMFESYAMQAGVRASGYMRAQPGSVVYQGYHRYADALNECRQRQSQYQSGALKLVRVTQQGTQVTGTVVAHTGFVNGNYAEFSAEQLASAASTGSCFALQDWHGRFLPVREDPNDPYAFRYEVHQELAGNQRAMTALTQAQTRLDEARSLALRSAATLSTNRAFQNQRCVEPAARTIPPRPAGMSSEEMTLHSVGGCVDQLFMAFSDTEASTALRRTQRYRDLDLWQEWRREGGYRDSDCGLNNLRSAELQQTGWSVITRALVGDRYSSDSLNGLLDRCIARAKQRCNGPLLAWEAERRAILLEPGAQMRQCREAVGNRDRAARLIPEAEAAVEHARSNAQRARATLASNAAELQNVAAHRCTVPGASTQIALLPIQSFNPASLLLAL